MKIKLSGLGYLFLFPLLALKAPSGKDFILDPLASTLTVSGVSSLHPWTAKASIFKGALHAVFSSGSLHAIDSATVQLQVRSLKSGKSAMDQNIYKSLKADSHPYISFLLKKCTIGYDQLESTGTLTIGGTSKNISVKSLYAHFNTRITIRGEFQVNMTDYDVRPPRFMLGAFKSSELVTIHYAFIFNSP